MNSLISKKKLFHLLSTTYEDDHFAFEMPFVCEPSKYFLF